jgi:hypothetical protein
MKSLIPRTRFNTAMLVITISAALSSYAAPPVPPNGPAVTVVNTLDNPVPVVQQGPVAISGNVNVANSAASPVLVRAVDSSTVQPVAESGLAVASTNGQGTIALYAVPAGKRLIVEYVSAWFRVPVGKKVYVAYLAGEHTPLRPIHLYLLPVFTGTDNTAVPPDDIYLVSQPVKYYVSAGHELGAGFLLSNVQGLGDFQFTGYLVDAP